MPVAFTPEERNSIRARLLDTARRLLPVVGLRKMSIDSLTREAGISKAAFYSFYSSKEALYLELIMQEGPGIAERVLTPLQNRSLPPAVALESFLKALMVEYAENPILRRLIEAPEELAAVRRKAGNQRMEVKRALGYEPILAFVREAQASGAMIAADPAAVLYTITAIPHLLLHKEELGGAEWGKTQALLIQCVVAGLFQRTNESESAV
ncbi:MAG: TetR/AcrR family transcriptional regulator [Cyanophyceae cyanobacterium]